jgi:hypothetical protein
LTDSPYSKELKDAFHFEDHDFLTQMTQELKKANPSCYLISGYRGVGKTSFINRIKEALATDTAFVSISVAKYDGYPIVIKKIIRQLYLSYTSIKKTDPSKNLDDKFSLLYDRTFNEVVQSEKELATNEKSKRTEMKVDLKKIIPILVSFILTICLSLHLFTLPYINELLLIASIGWTLITQWEFTWSSSKTSVKSLELARTTLYDNEIAEHHLLQVLSELKAIGIKTIIVFDELDKIKSTSTVEGIVNDLKALLLSGVANFFVIAGQGLYYQLEKSHGDDDPVISSLFSKNIHIPFPRYSSLKKFLLNLINDSEQTKNDLLNAFLDSMILNAARVPRKLSNIVRQNLNWENEQAFIEIPETFRPQFERESKLLSITTKVLDSDLPNITSNLPKSDFFIAQIHLWLNKIRTFSSRSWTVAEITQSHRYDIAEYPREYIAQLDPLCELFFDRLIEDKLLKKGTDSNGIVIYEWDGDEKASVDKNVDIAVIAEPSFLTEFIELEHYVRGIYVDLVDGATLQNTQLSIKQMINKLIEIGAFSKTWTNSKKLDALIEVRNKVAHGSSIDNYDLDVVQSSRFDISRLKSELIEDYTFFVTKKFLKTFELTKDTSSSFDFVARNSDNIYILFDVKYAHYSQKAARNVNDIIDKYMNYLKSSGRKSYYVLFYYQPNGRKSYDEFYSQFFDVLKNRFPEISDRFFLFYTSEYRGDASTGRLETYLQQVLSKVSVKVKPTAINNSIQLDDAFDNADNRIKEKAKSEWPDNYQMQLYEIEKQQAAVLELKKGKPNDLTEDEFEQIRTNAKAYWPNDFQMWLYEEQKQIEGLRKLRNS